MYGVAQNRPCEVGLKWFILCASEEHCFENQTILSLGDERYLCKCIANIDF